MTLLDHAGVGVSHCLGLGGRDLSAEKGQRASVYRYNHSNDYVDLVLSIMKAYQSGERSHPSMRGIAEERIDPVLLRMSRDYVGDMAETVALLWPTAADGVPEIDDGTIRIADAVETVAGIAGAIQSVSAIDDEVVAVGLGLDGGLCLQLPDLRPVLNPLPGLVGGEPERGGELGWGQLDLTRQLVSPACGASASERLPRKPNWKA